MSTKPPIICFVLNDDIKYRHIVKNKLLLSDKFTNCITKYTKNMFPTHDTVRVYGGCMQPYMIPNDKNKLNHINIIQLSIYDLMTQQLCLIMKFVYLLKYIIYPVENKDIIGTTEVMYQQLYENIILFLDKYIVNLIKQKKMDINNMKKKSIEEKKECYDILLDYLDKQIKIYDIDDNLSKLNMKSFLIMNDIYDSEQMTNIEDFNEEFNFIKEILQDTCTSSIKKTLDVIYDHQKKLNRLVFIIIKKNSFRVIQKAMLIYDDIEIDFHIINHVSDLNKLEKSESLKLVNTNL
jgi:hypothetical protein